MGRMQTIHGLNWVILASTFLAIAIWESFRPRRALVLPEGKRWTSHLILLFSEPVFLYAVLRWSSPTLVAAAFAQSRHGLLNFLSLPLVVRCVLAILALDLTRFATHWACHAVPILWRLHQVHHSDPDFDVTTAGRFHPVESLFTTGGEMCAIALLSLPVAGVLAWQMISTFQGLFNHANATLPRRLEKLIRIVFYTSDLHRIHHSEEITEQNRNFGEIFPMWDRLFRTYLSSPAAGQAGLLTGLKEFPQERGADLGYLLVLPFRSRRQPVAEVEAGPEAAIKPPAEA